MDHRNKAVNAPLRFVHSGCVCIVPVPDSRELEIAIIVSDQTTERAHESRKLLPKVLVEEFKEICHR